MLPATLKCTWTFRAWMQSDLAVFRTDEIHRHNSRPQLCKPINDLQFMRAAQLSYRLNRWNVQNVRLTSTQCGDVIHPQLWESGSGYETSFLLLLRRERHAKSKSQSGVAILINCVWLDVCKIYMITSESIQNL